MRLFVRELNVNREAICGHVLQCFSPWISRWSLENVTEKCWLLAHANEWVPEKRMKRLWSASERASEREFASSFLVHFSSRVHRLHKEFSRGIFSSQSFATGVMWMLDTVLSLRSFTFLIVGECRGKVYMRAKKRLKWRWSMAVSN